MKTSRILLTILFLIVVGNGVVYAGPPRVSVGIQFGVPLVPRYYTPHYHGYCGPRYVDYYRYRYYEPRPIIIERPVVVNPRPIIVEQPRVIVQPTTQSPYQSNTPSYNNLPSNVPELPQPQQISTVDISSVTRALSSPDERIRMETAMQLGRMKSVQSVDSLAATLAGDQSPLVRESAARALGLIGSPRALTALTHAAQADSDRDVRRSAQFAVEVIQTNSGR